MSDRNIISGGLCQWLLRITEYHESEGDSKCAPRHSYNCN